MPERRREACALPKGHCVSMSKASATKLDPEAQEAAAPPPPGSRRRRFAGAAAVAALVLLSLGELLLPLPDVGGAWAAKSAILPMRALQGERCTAARPRKNFP